MVSLCKFISVFILFGLVAAQPPDPNGRDSSFLAPLDPPSEGLPLALEANVESNPSPTPTVSCRRVRIRPITGRCTNRRDASLGEARRAHFSYFDVDSREFLDNGLKSPREISNIVADQEGNIFNSRSLNELLVFFGQFLDHNVVATPLSDEEQNIEPPPGSTEKLLFRRSLRAETGEGDGERPVNILPSAVDLVAVYGPNEPRNIALREPNSCKLKTSEGAFGDLLPFNTGNFSNAPSSSPAFYFAGDHRANEHPILTSLHTLWLREHNYLCDQLAPKLPFLSPSNLYEAARSVNIAQFQKVVFEEFFPSITGRTLPRYRGFRSGADPTLSSVFSTAAFRVGHTMIGEMLTEISAAGTVQTPLRENFFIPRRVEAAGIDPFLRGAAQTLAQEVDTKVVDSLRNFLFDGIDGEEGPDLIALNLQRSRDHNIPSFNAIRAEFGIRPARTFADITRDSDMQERLEAAYDSVDDVEAWVGMMAEDNLSGSSFGRTLFLVWRREFLRLRTGDQFFYLNRRSIPVNIVRRIPEIVGQIRNPGVKLFKDIIARNTGIPTSDLNSVDVFKVPS